MAIVYQATNRVNGKRYVGSTIRPLKVRKYRHHTDANNGATTAFHRAIRKYGKDAFDWVILSVHESAIGAAVQEIKVIAELKPEYNMTDGGDGPLTALGRTTIGLANKGRKHTAETRAKMSAAHRGRKYGPRSDNSERNSKRVWTLEMREKVAASLRGRKLPEEHRRNAAAAQLGRKPTTQRSVICITDGRTFASGREAERAYGLPIRSIAEACRPKRKGTRGFVGALQFSYIGETVVVSQMEHPNVSGP